MLITAGPTREYLDPVRFFSNESTGTMGLACASEAYQRGHQVKLVCGPGVCVPGAKTPPLFFKKEKGFLFSVVTAREMLAVLQRHWRWADALIMAAAVSDFRPRRRVMGKISKAKRETMVLTLVRNLDVLKILSHRKENRCLVGFSLETRKGLRNSCKKLREKKLDLVVCNWLNMESLPFGNRKTTVVILDREGNCQWLKNTPKTKVAKALVDKIEQICYQKRMRGGD